MKPVPFKGANFLNDTVFLSNTRDYALICMKLSFKDKVKLLFGCPLWMVTSPIGMKEKHLFFIQKGVKGLVTEDNKKEEV